MKTATAGAAASIDGSDAYFAFRLIKDTE